MTKTALLSRLIFLSFLFVVTSCHKRSTAETGDDSGSIPHPDHIIFVWLENKGYPQIIGNPDAPYINSLVERGTLFTNSYAVFHPSYPNYIAFFSGSDQGVAANSCIEGAPFKSENLYTELKKVNKSFAWYSEDLPAAGSSVCQAGSYVEKHNPTTVFSNVEGSANKPFSAFPSDFSKLENVVCISPNLMHDMHDGSINQGDTWIKNNLSRLEEWCRSHNSVFVIYWDEDNYEYDNRIPVIAVGERVKANFKLNTRYNHYNWTKTVCAMFGASGNWSAHLNDKNFVMGCWQ